MAAESDASLALSKGPTYVYEPVGGTYVFAFRDGTSRTLSRQTVESIVVDYVEDGNDMSIQQVCVAHGLMRWEFGQIKAALALTKKHEPFTPEQLEDLPESDLVEKSVAAKRRRLERRASGIAQNQVRLYASKWLALQREQLDPIEEIYKRLLKETPPPPVFVTSPSDETPEAVVVHMHISDLHYGMLATRHGDRPYDRSIAKQRVVQATEALVRWLGTFEAVEYVILPCGGDWFHVDNVHGRTASFKHTMDCDGVPEEIADEGMSLYIWMVQRVLDAGYRVRIEVVPGNHDTMLSVACGRAAALVFQHDSRVDVGNVISTYAYLVYGDVALVLHHGHGLKSSSDLGSVLDRWLRQEVVTARHRYALTGNLHHVKIEEGASCTLLQQPSPAGHDRFATTGGWVTARPAVAMFAFSPTKGLTDVRSVPFD